MKMPTDKLTTLDEQERQIETQLNDLEARLRKEYAPRNGGEEAVHDVLSMLRERFADARIITFLPILIERAARTELTRTS